MRLDHSEVRNGFPISHQLVEREFIIAGGTLEGALKSLKRVSLLILPRTHHAFSTHGEAFCLLNDQAIAARYLLDNQKPKSFDHRLGCSPGQRNCRDISKRRSGIYLFDARSKKLSF